MRNVGLNALRRRFGTIAASALWLPIGVSSWPAGAAPIEIDWHGLVDVRYAQLAASPGWLDSGLGKLRFGRATERFRVNEALLTAQARIGWDWAATLTGKYASRASQPIDLTEAFLSYRPVSTTPWRFSARIGYFFAPISLENVGVGWSSPYTLTSSAINTWVGEELRSLGADATVSRGFENGDRAALVGGLFASNDTAGALLAWRGWALHDYEATLHDRLPLPRGLGVGRNFPEQDGHSEPFVEVDGNPGYYAGLAYERPEQAKVRVLYYDNRGRPDALQAGQYGWHTRFWSFGGKAELPWNVTVLGQGVVGRTAMGPLRNDLRAVDVRFWSYFALVSKAVGRHRISARYEQFGTSQHDYLPGDANVESGQAWTVDYNLTVADHHQLSLEWLRVSSHRPARAGLGLSARQEETQWQLSYRYFF